MKSACQPARAQSHPAGSASRLRTLQTLFGAKCVTSYAGSDQPASRRRSSAGLDCSRDLTEKTPFCRLVGGLLFFFSSAAPKSARCVLCVSFVVITRQHRARPLESKERVWGHTQPAKDRAVQDEFPEARVRLACAELQ
ncbi:hypothetical protein MRX96_044710 [Rhipicephalus microplus]